MSLRKTAIFAAIVAALSIGAADAWARAGGGSSSGSRGGRTYSAPSATPTAPRSAAPIERSMTPQTSPSPGMASPGMARPGGLGGFLSGGFGKGLLGGLLGAGLIGMLMGHGFMGGLGGLMSILGLVLQIGLLILVVRLAMNWFRNRQQPAFAGPQGGADQAYRNAGGPLPGGGGAPAFGKVEIAKADFDAFERRLGEVQAAYSNEDGLALGRLATPEMVGYFRQEVEANAARGQVNRIGGVRLLQGDLAEAWREPGAEYATVAMRFALTDAMVDKASGKVVSGSTTETQEATELWTFRRPTGADSTGWVLSAIQQTR
jgi:predicted lipid-binding transport protein (Tim44 family)